MGCEPVEARMRSVQIVVDPPVFNNVPGMAIAAEQMLVEAFISQSSIEAFDKSILHRLARGEIGGAKFDHGSGGIVLLRAA